MTVLKMPLTSSSAKSAVQDGPDFLCVGQMKSGTAWLYDQLLFQPGFWMPPVKELHYLDRSFPNKKIEGRIGRVLADFARKSSGSERKEAKGIRVMDERDRAFFEAARECINQPSNLDQYAALFQPKGNELSGDITPRYCGIDEAMIDQVVARFPKLKVMIILRQPVQRAISHVAMSYRNGKIPEAALQDLELFKEALADNIEILEKSLGSAQVERWRSRLPPDQFAFFFFDDLVKRPEVLRREILSFLGADPEVPNSQFPPNFNRKAKEIKPDIAPEILDYLKRELTEELEKSAKMLGGQAQEWLVRHQAAEKEQSRTQVA